jgi:hypothetical protein
MTTKDFIKLILAVDSSRGDTLEIYYRDGSSVEGWVQKTNSNYDPPFVNFCKTTTERGMSSDHTIEFDKIVRIVLNNPYKDPVIYNRSNGM